MMVRHPCKDCIVKGLCRIKCDKLMGDDNILRHMIICNDCPDCGNDRTYLNFSYNPNYNNNNIVDQFNILCIDCACYISIYMNLNDLINVNIDSRVTSIYLPSTNRINQQKKRFYFRDRDGETIVTTFTDALRLYIMPSITRKYGKLSKNILNNGKWKPDTWKEIRQ
jgi:hypothetical protein